MLEKNPGKVKLVLKHFPLKNHKYALRAAVATEVAGRGKAFWEFHDLLFENYNRLNNDKILDIAVELGFNRDEFEKAMKNPDLYRRIQMDVNDGIKAGVKGVPKVFINGRGLKRRTLAGFQTMIDAELKKLSSETKKD